MANNERLTKRLKKIEDWVAENEMMGGPKGYLDTMVSMYQGNIHGQEQMRQVQVNFEQLRNYVFEFLKEQDLIEEWDEFLAEKDNAVQKQQAEEVPVQEETKDSKETIETPKEE